MILRYPIEGNQDYCVMTHLGVMINGRMYTRCCIVPSFFDTDMVNEVMDFEEGADIQMFIGEAREKPAIEEEDKVARRRAYQRERYHRLKGK